jgi:hypothetical protein
VKNLVVAENAVSAFVIKVKDKVTLWTNIKEDV